MRFKHMCFFHSWLLFTYRVKVSGSISVSKYNGLLLIKLHIEQDENVTKYK